VKDQDIIKSAAKFISEKLAEEGIKVGSSHIHSAVSAYCGFNSKKALIDNGPSMDDENIILSIDPDLPKLSDIISKMKETPLKSCSVDYVGGLINTALTPKCECCGIKDEENQPIGDPETPYFEPNGWVCPNCAASKDEYATCRFCDPDVIYRADQVNERGECLEEHNGESVMDDEEEKGWNDYIEYWTKDQ